MKKYAFALILLLPLVCISAVSIPFLKPSLLNLKDDLEEAPTTWLI